MNALAKITAEESLGSGSSNIAIPLDAFHPSHRRPNGHLKVLDLFAGAGGFSLGFELAGCSVVGAVEIDAWACDTLRLNHPQTRVVQSDIAKMSDAEIREIGADCDVIVGGPPCQGFSVANNRAGDPTDPRNSLFREFVRAVGLIKPKAFILENVPGLLKRRSSNKELVIDIIVSEFEKLGYAVDYQVLEAQSFGVPQLRPRLFVTGYLNRPASFFPSPTHASAPESLGLFDRTSQSLLPYVTLWSAISDLPDLEARQGAEYLPHTKAPTNDYQRLLRADGEGTSNSVAMRHSARMVERFSHILWGQSGSDAPEEHRSRKRGDYSSLSGKSYSQNNRRMHPDRPCHTVPASFYANFIHPFSHRNFTPREGARIQSFPDWYRFEGKPTVVSTRLLAREERNDELHLCQYNQIGNAVPPLVSYHLAKHVIRQLTGQGPKV